MKLVPREYQQNIYKSILRNGNTLVVLPTGLGKTLIALMLIEEKMKIGRCLFLSPTKPLCQQHFQSIKSTMGLSEENVTIVTGDLPPFKRQQEYSKKVIVATPQTIRNDLNDKITSPDFALVIFDEGHRAVGKYAYTQIAQQTSQTALHVALTASPGGKKERINEVMAQLSLKNVEIRSSKDEDVKPYTHEVKISWKFVDLSPSYKLIKFDLDQLIKKHARTLAAMGFPPPLQSKTQFMQLRARILATDSKLKFPALIQYSILLNLLHMVELLETQSMQIFADYLNGLTEKETKSAKILLKNPVIQDLAHKCEIIEDHPKLKLLLDALSTEKGKKAIIFAHYRAQVKALSSKLNSLGYSAKPFMGKKDGFNRKQQEETIESFRKGEFDYLIASSIGEEGLDIPAVDLVIFYEPIPSEIRSIQRRGRTGRFAKGQVYILITKNTRDEYFYWASLNREKKMKNILASFVPANELPTNPQIPKESIPIEETKKSGFISTNLSNKKERKPKNKKPNEFEEAKKEKKELPKEKPIENPQKSKPSQTKITQF